MHFRGVMGGTEKVEKSRSGGEGEYTLTSLKATFRIGFTLLGFG